MSQKFGPHNNNPLHVTKDAYLNNYSKTTNYAQNYLLNCFYSFYCGILLQAALHFVQVTPTFQTTIYAFLNAHEA